MDRDLDESLPDYVYPGTGEIITRTMQRVAGRKVIIIHRTKLVRPNLTSHLTHPLEHLAYGDPARFSGKGFVFNEPRNPWAEAGAEPTTAFNCHTYALGGRVGLVPGDLINGVPQDSSMDTNPMEILLASYFRQDLITDAIPSRVMNLAQNTQLQEGDVISFSGRLPKFGITHLHSGRARRVEDEWWLASKIGEGRLIVAPIWECLFLYPKDLQKVRVYRFRY